MKAAEVPLLILSLLLGIAAAAAFEMHRTDLAARLGQAAVISCAAGMLCGKLG